MPPAVQLSALITCTSVFIAGKNGLEEKRRQPHKPVMPVDVRPLIGRAGRRGSHEGQGQTKKRNANLSAKMHTVAARNFPKL